MIFLVILSGLFLFGCSNGSQDVDTIERPDLNEVAITERDVSGFSIATNEPTPASLNLMCAIAQLSCSNQIFFDDTFTLMTSQESFTEGEESEIQELIISGKPYIIISGVAYFPCVEDTNGFIEGAREGLKKETLPTQGATVTYKSEIESQDFGDESFAYLMRYYTVTSSGSVVPKQTFSVLAYKGRYVFSVTTRGYDYAYLEDREDYSYLENEATRLMKTIEDRIDKQ